MRDGAGTCGLHAIGVGFRPQFHKKHGRPTHSVSLTGSDTLATALTKLAENRIHRLYIVDDANRPIGICSLKDILAEVTGPPP